MHISHGSNELSEDLLGFFLRYCAVAEKIVV